LWFVRWSHRGKKVSHNSARVSYNTPLDNTVLLQAEARRKVAEVPTRRTRSRCEWMRTTCIGVTPFGLMCAERKSLIGHRIAIQDIPSPFSGASLLVSMLDMAAYMMLQPPNIRDTLLYSIQDQRTGSLSSWTGMTADPAARLRGNLGSHSPSVIRYAKGEYCKPSFACEAYIHVGMV